MATWEPKVLPPHPSTVSDLSENAQKVLAAIERNWEAAFIRNKPTTVVGPSGRNLACNNYNYRPSPNHYQHNYGSQRYGGLPPPISPTVAYGSQSQATYPASQVRQDGIFNKPQQSRTGAVAWQQLNPLRRYDPPSQGSVVMSNSCVMFPTNISPRYGASPAFNNSDKGHFLPLQPQTLPKPWKFPPQALKPPQCLPNFSRTVPNNDPWNSPSSASQAPNISQSLLLSSQVSQQIAQIKSPNLRTESPGMEFGSDDEGQDWTQALTQRNVLSQQRDVPKTPETLLHTDKTIDTIETIGTEINGSQTNSLSQLSYTGELQTEAAVSMDTGETWSTEFDPISHEQSPILPTISKLTSPVVSQSVNVDHSPIILIPSTSIMTQELKIIPEKTLKLSTADTLQIIASKDSKSSSRIQKQQSQGKSNKHEKPVNIKLSDSKGLQIKKIIYNKNCQGNIAEARAKLIENVLKEKNPEKNKVCDERLLKDTKRTVNAESRDTVSTSLGIIKKKKFQTPFRSQQSQLLSSNTKPESKDQLFNQKENIKITTLTYEEIKNLRRKIQSTPPIEICITIMYKEGYCQLSKTREDIKKNTSCNPNGLMFAILSENDPVKFYLLPIDENNEERNTFSDEKCLIKNILLAPCRKICFKSQELFVYLMHIYKFKYHEVSLQWIAIDPLIGCWLLNSDEPPINFDQVMKQLGLNKKQDQQSKLHIQACKNLVFLSQAVETMYQKLVEKELWRVFLDLESKITSVLAVMEMEGIPVDKKILKEIGNNLETQIRQLQSKANKLIGYPVLLTSPQQLRKILYEQLKLDSKIKIPLTLQGGGKSTSESVLKLLETLHPLPGLILEFRHLQKLNSTYIDGILQYVSEGKLFTTWEQIAAATGRVISRDPNVQAIPKQALCLTGEGETKKEIELRSAFKSEEGHSFLAADFQHIELRLLTHFAQDPALSAMFVQTEKDVFQLLARQWLGLSTSREVTDEERDKTKRVVYAVMYGAGISKLQQVLQVDSEEARSILSTFTAKFPQIRNFSKKLIWKARDQGYIASLSGRRRQFPNITSSDMKLRSQSERQAVNFLIQGSAADVCKVAMLATEQAQQELSPPLNAQLLLQIHDELVWQVPDSQLDQFTEVVQRAMEGTQNHFKISLPLPVTLGSGKNWADLQ